MSLRKFMPVLGVLVSLAAMPASALQVVASVKPLQLVAAALLDGVAEPDVLVPPGASPHNYALKPSDMRRLTSADLVIWVGPRLELFLDKPLQQAHGQVLQLLPGSAGAEDGHHDEGADRQDGGADPHDGEAHHHDGDAHVWMDPDLMRDAARRIEQALVTIAPQHKDRLAANLAHFNESLDAEDRVLRHRLAPLAERGFFVFHDAYGRFVRYYGLRQLGYFTVDPSRQPGARRLAEIRHELKARQAVCVFSEPQFRSAVVDAVTEDTGVRHGELDPLGLQVALGPDGYVNYLEQLGGAFEHCLANGS